MYKHFELAHSFWFIVITGKKKLTSAFLYKVCGKIVEHFP